MRQLLRVLHFMDGLPAVGDGLVVLPKEKPAFGMLADGFLLGLNKQLVFQERLQDIIVEGVVGISIIGLAANGRREEVVKVRIVDRRGMMEEP